MALKKSELYSSLWSSCDELRGGMDASQYKDYVLVLLFVKYVSDKYAGQVYAPITIPPGASFADMVALKGTTDIGDQINKKILGPLAKSNNLSDMPDFNDPNKLGSGKDMVEKLTNLIAIFENPALDFSKYRADGEPVQPPKNELEHIHYFCGNTEIPDDLKAHETQRVALYKSAATLLRAYANIADDLPNAGYTGVEIAQIKEDLDRYIKLREIIRKASGETIDLKAYEADMRHLIDTYIEARAPRPISDFGDMGLLDVLVNSGMSEAINSLPDSIKNNREAVAETIANNVRSKIIKDHLNDPVFYDKMSALLQEIIADLRAKRIDYEEFLRRMAKAAKQVQEGKSDDTPEKLDTPGKRALYNNLRPVVRGMGGFESPVAYGDQTSIQVIDLAIKIDETVKRIRPDDWRGVKTREQVIKHALHEILKDVSEVERIFLIIEKQREY